MPWVRHFTQATALVWLHYGLEVTVVKQRGVSIALTLFTFLSRRGSESTIPGPLRLINSWRFRLLKLYPKMRRCICFLSTCSGCSARIFHLATRTVGKSALCVILGPSPRRLD